MLLGRNLSFLTPSEKLPPHIKFCLTTDDVHELVTGLARELYRTENPGICRSHISMHDG